MFTTVSQYMLLLLFVIIGISIALFFGERHVRNGFRSRLAMRILEILHATISANAPLTTLLRAYAATEGRTVRKRLERMVVDLENGQPLSDVLALHVPHMDHRQIRLLAMGERSGRIAQVLEHLATESTRELDSRTLLGSTLYPLLMFGAVLNLFWFLSLTILPKFAEISSDFEMNLPPITKLFSIDDWPMPSLMVLQLVVLVITLLLPIQLFFTWRWWSGERGVLERLFSPIGDAVFSRLPIAGRLRKDRQHADLCFVLAVGMRGQLPFDAILDEARRVRLSGTLRKRIEDWRTAIQCGTGTIDAGRASGMDAELMRFLETGLASGQPVDAMMFLHRYYSQRFSRAVYLLRACIAPAVVILTGVLIGIMCMAIVTPLSQWIDRLSQVN